MIYGGGMLWDMVWRRKGGVEEEEGMKEGGCSRIKIKFQGWNVFNTTLLLDIMLLIKVI